MRQRLDARLRAGNDQRRWLLDEVEALQPERLIARPFPGKWSILEIVEHLVLAEHEVLQRTPEPPHLVERHRGVKDRIRYRMAMFVLRSGIAVKMPSRRFAPRGDCSLADLRRRWDTSQRWLRSYVEGLDERDLDKAVFAHPVAGPMTVEQAVRMGELHLATHARQIRRLESLTS